MFLSEIGAKEAIQHHELPEWSPTPVLNGPIKLNFAIRNGMRCELDGMAVSMVGRRVLSDVLYGKRERNTKCVISYVVLNETRKFFLHLQDIPQRKIFQYFVLEMIDLMW